MTTAGLLAGSVLLILACGVFVAAEFALVTVDRILIEQQALAGDKRAAGVATALSSLSTHLSGAQLGITLTNLGIGFLAEPAVEHMLHPALHDVNHHLADAIGLVVSLLGASIVTMIYGELVPKNIALARPAQVARSTQGLLRAWTTMTRWPINGLNALANATVRKLGAEPQEELRSARSSGELTSLIQHSADQGTLDPDTAELMERSVEFASRTAGEIMTPRVRTASLHESDRAEAVIELTRTTGHSRFPVLDDEGQVVGTVHVKNAVALPVHERPYARVRNLMARPVVVPDSLRLDPLLQLLRRQGMQMAVVADEYGDQAGIVTLEDVIEEIVGAIADEHDPTDTSALQQRDGRWTISGLLRPDEVEDLTGISLPEHEDYDTVAGLVLWLAGEIPAVGDDVSVETGAGTAHLKVMAMDGLRVARIELREEA